MSKFRRLYETVSQRGFIEKNQKNLFSPEMASLNDLSIAHSPSYLEGLFSNRICQKAWRRVGLPWSRGLLDRTMTAPNGTLLAARLA